MVRCTGLAGRGRLRGCIVQTITRSTNPALALVMHRIKGAGKSGAERESVAARMDAGRNKTPKGGGGLSPEAVAIIRAEVEGDWYANGPRRHTTKARTGSISTAIRCAAPVRHEPPWAACPGPPWATLGRFGPEWAGIGRLKILFRNLPGFFRPGVRARSGSHVPVVREPSHGPFQRSGGGTLGEPQLRDRLRAVNRHPVPCEPRTLQRQVRLPAQDHALQQRSDEVAAHETRRAGHQSPHRSGAAERDDGNLAVGAGAVSGEARIRRNHLVVQRCALLSLGYMRAPAAKCSPLVSTETLGSEAMFKYHAGWRSWP